MRMQTLLDEALEAWAYTRHGVIAELRNLPAGRLDVRPAEGGRTAAELVRHIIESGLMMAGELSRPDGDFTRKPYPKLIAEYAGGVERARTKAQLVDRLVRSHADGDRRIRRAGERFMLQYITRFDGLDGTRFAWMHHAVSHEEYHRGQLALYARLMGKVPALTRLIHG